MTEITFKGSRDMNITRIDQLRCQPTEMEWLEFKRNRCEPEQLGEYLSALANSACLAGQRSGYLIFGIDDETHEVVGTNFDPRNTKAKGNQDLLLWLAAGLHPNTGFEPRIVDHPAGRVVVFEVAPARDHPVNFYGTAYIRVGTSKTKLSNHPEKARAIWTHGNDWSAEVCEQASLHDLAPEAIAKAREQFVVRHPARATEVEGWDDTTFLNKARVLQQGTLTNAALLLLGQPEASALLVPAVAQISWVLKDAHNRELDCEHIDPPFLLAGDHLLQRIRNLTVRALPNGTLFPKEFTQYDPWVIREALHNSIAHQDYRLRGRIVVVEFPARISLTNVGDFLPGDVATVIRQDAPQAIYRNPFLARAMVELNLIDTQGGGIKRMFDTQRKRSFPLPDYDLTEMETSRVTVSLHGCILDERYTRLLMERTDLDLNRAILSRPRAKGTAYQPTRASPYEGRGSCRRPLPEPDGRRIGRQGDGRGWPPHPRARIRQAVLLGSDHSFGTRARAGQPQRDQSGPDTQVARPTDGRAEVVKGPQSHTGTALLRSDCQPRHPRSTRLGTHRRAPKE